MLRQLLSPASVSRAFQVDRIAGVVRFGKPNSEYQIGPGSAGMGRPPAKDLTERELEVMHAFWRHGEATAAEARDRLAATGLDRTYTTIANLVRGLADKGFLRQVNDEKPFRYRADRSYEDVSGRLLGDVLQRVFRGSRAQLLKRLVEQRALTAEERDLLEQVLKERDR
jgi:predicted transcriptional regulator